jgi:hypothetical protein
MNSGYCSGNAIFSGYGPIGRIFEGARNASIICSGTQFGRIMQIVAVGLWDRRIVGPSSLFASGWATSD